MVMVTVSNRAERILCVLVEPLGEDFWITPNQTLWIAVPDHQAAIDWYEEGASVWVNDGDPYAVVVTTAAGDIVKCGFQRPPGAFEQTSPNW